MSDTVKKWHEMQEDKAERLNEIAEEVADVVMDMIYKSVDWQISDFNTDGDEHYAIHDAAMQLVLKKLSKKIR